MEDDLLGCALLAQDAQHVVVGVAVVDHQRLADPLGQVDVPAEVHLLVDRLGAVPVVVEARLADGDHPRVGRQPLELGIPRVVQARDLGRVDGDRGVDVRMGVARRRRTIATRRRCHRR